MKIDAQMNLGRVAEMMGSEATPAEAEAMVSFLLTGDYADTDEVGEREWLELCELAVEGAARNAELDTQRSEAWVAWIDGAKADAVEFQVPVAGTFDVAQAGADALGIDVCSELNVERK